MLINLVPIWVCLENVSSVFPVWMILSSFQLFLLRGLFFRLFSNGHLTFPCPYWILSVFRGDSFATFFCQFFSYVCTICLLASSNDLAVFERLPAMFLSTFCMGLSSLYRKSFPFHLSEYLAVWQKVIIGSTSIEHLRSNRRCSWINSHVWYYTLVNFSSDKAATPRTVSISNCFFQPVDSLKFLQSYCIAARQTDLWNLASRSEALSCDRRVSSRKNTGKGKDFSRSGIIDSTVNKENKKKDLPILPSFRPLCCSQSSIG